MLQTTSITILLSCSKKDTTHLESWFILTYVGIFHIFYQEFFWSLYSCHGHHGFRFIEHLHLNVLLIFFYNYNLSKTLHKEWFNLNVLITSWWNAFTLILLFSSTILSLCEHCVTHFLAIVTLNLFFQLDIFTIMFFLRLHLHFYILFKFKPLDEKNALSPLNTQYLFCILTVFSCFNNCIINVFNVYWLSSKVSYAHVTKL
jgi:hypothetical protein